MSRGGDDLWLQQKIDRLVVLWAQGLKTPDIALHLGVSKSAVVGKVHRLKLPTRRSGTPRGKGAPEWDDARRERFRLAWAEVPVVPIKILAKRMNASVRTLWKVAAEMRLPVRPAAVRGEYVPPEPAVRVAAQVVRPVVASLPGGSVEGAVPVVLPRHRGTCCWPLTSGRPWVFCSEPAERGRNYCEVHNAKAFVRKVVAA